MNIIIVSLIAFGGRIFKIFPLIKSNPGALLVFVALIKSIYSCAVVLSMVQRLSVVLLAFSTSSFVYHLGILLLISYGENVFCRCFENSSACSSLLLAHVLSIFLIAGIDFIVFSTFLVTFHRE